MSERVYMIIREDSKERIKARHRNSNGTVIIKESRGYKRMTDNELRDSVKAQVNMVIDDLYLKVSNAHGLNPKSKYSFKIAITNPITKEVMSRKLSFHGDEIITVRDLINNNRVKAGTIKRVLKKEAWKIIYAIIKENI